MILDPDQLATQLDFVHTLGKTVAPHAFRLSGQVLAFTGADPFEVDDLVALLPPGVIWYADDDLPEDADIDVVIVGQEDWSEETIKAALEFSAQPPRFLPQEGFLDELLFGHNWWTEWIAYLNKALDYYPGLRYAKSLETFPWPRTQPPIVIDPPGSGRDRLPETRLRHEGYQITGMTRAQRWGVLTTRAVPKLGLQEVAGTIASLVRARKIQGDGRTRYRNAIGEWENDLQRLKTEFYPTHGHLFTWPSTEP